jgi:hypothetical protein
MEPVVTIPARLEELAAAATELDLTKEELLEITPRLEAA